MGDGTHLRMLRGRPRCAISGTHRDHVVGRVWWSRGAVPTLCRQLDLLNGVEALRWQRIIGVTGRQQGGDGFLVSVVELGSMLAPGLSRLVSRRLWGQAAQMDAEDCARRLTEHRVAWEHQLGGVSTDDVTIPV